ncbi:YVTN repeat-like/Quino protein amine dehydrogenase [Suillus brevipes Sb2]|nr:YVTN repeat-like/Quino protein amine dehydrogenase [Suillus brevipes Sb2]
MASTSTQAILTADKSILIPVMTLEGHEPYNIPMSDGKQHEYNDVEFISYFPDGKQMISGSRDKTVRRWDLRKGKEIEKDRQVYEGVQAVGVSRDGRWVVINAGGNGIKVSEVETGIVRTFDEDDLIDCIDISGDSTLLAGASYSKVWIWNLDTGELVAGPFKLGGYVPEAVRFSEDSRKLAVSSQEFKERHLEVWDVQTEKLDVQKSTHGDLGYSSLRIPIFWTTKHKSIVTTFNSTDDAYEPKTISEFDASTLKTVGAPFKHTYSIRCLALSSDCVLLASSCHHTVKLWAFESRQLLATFDVEFARTLILSPDSRQLAYTTFRDSKICICDIPADILASIESTNKSAHPDLLNSSATRPSVRRKPVIIPVTSSIPHGHPPKHLHTSDSHAFLHSLRKLFPFSRTGAAHTDLDEPSNPFDFPATLPLPRSHIPRTPAPPTTESSVINTSSTLPSRLYRLWPLQTNHASPTIVDVPLAPGKLRIATAGAPSDDDDLIRDEDYVSPPPSPNPASRPGIVNTGQHGSGRFCFCF